MGGNPLARQEAVLQELKQAKDALITYAVIDAKKPGRLLCPDLLGNGISPLLSRDDCDAYGGFLPWKTLALKQSGDNDGTSYYYFLTKWFGGNRSTPPLNSDTPTTLHLDVPLGSSSNDIAALIIATRGSLDTRNADGDDYFYNGTSNAPEDNDVIVAVTRQELMAAVEQRIANELRTCLENHSTSPENPQRAYPWPAPLSNNIFKGTDGSLFGMIPDTQFGNPELALKETIAKLSTIKNSLILPSTVEEAKTQVSNLGQLQQTAAYARAVFDQLYSVALALNISALNASTSFGTLDTILKNATVDKTTYTSVAASIPSEINSALPSLGNLQAALANSGFDIFLTELQTQNNNLTAAQVNLASATNVTTINKTQAVVNEFNNRLLNYASTPNPEIETLINNAFSASDQAASSLNSAKKLLTAESINQALSDTQVLIRNNQLLIEKIPSIRAISASAITISTLQRSLTISDNIETRNSLLSALSFTKEQLNVLINGTTAMADAQRSSQTAIDQALNAVITSDGDLALIQSAATRATSTLNALAQLLNDNVAIESLKTMVLSLNAAVSSPPSSLTGGKALRTPVKAIIYWSDTIAYQADDIATKARRGVIGGVPNKEDNDSSTYKAASRLLSTLDGSEDSIALMQKYANSAKSTDLADANAAFASTQNMLNDLLTKAQQLDDMLNAGMAEAAVPTTWFSDACNLLKPPTGEPTWWRSNEWKNLFFYQIDEQIRPATGKLNVNSVGAYRHVVLSAGRSIWSNASAPCEWKIQNRATIPRSTATWLESGNTHISRDGDAKTPIKTFTSNPLTTKNQVELDALRSGCIAPITYPSTDKYPITIFNDRLAH